MTPSLWFCVPVHGRLDLAAICLKQLRRTCDLLHGQVTATAVLIGDSENLEGLADRVGHDLLGFQTVERDNQFLSRKFNDGFQLALDPAYNPSPADYVVPFGSDDWVDHRLFIGLPGPDTVVGFQRMSFVREDAAEISTTVLNYRGGSGIRIYPRQLLEPLGYRPADEDRYRACDTNILSNVSLHHGDRLRVSHQHLHDQQIVDWKSPTDQLNSYHTVVRSRPSVGAQDPFRVLAGVYPAESLAEMRDHYALVTV